MPTPPRTARPGVPLCPGGEIPAVGTGSPGPLAGPNRRARILGVTARAAYLEVHDGGTPPHLVGVLAADAVRLPGTISLPEGAASTVLRDLAAATRLEVGQARVSARGPSGSLSIRIRRWWHPPPPRAATSADVVRDRLALARAVLAGPASPTSGLDTAAHRVLTGSRELDDSARARTLCQTLLGRGPGLTPSGDDALCGVLLAHAHFAGPAATHVLATSALRLARRTTTALSAALVAHATRGAACPEALAFLDTLSGHRPVGSALAALRRVGHTSGIDLAFGACAGASAALVRPGSTDTCVPDPTDTEVQV